MQDRSHLSYASNRASRHVYREQISWRFFAIITPISHASSQVLTLIKCAVASACYAQTNMNATIRAHAAWRGRGPQTAATHTFALLNPLLAHVVRTIGRRYPEIFQRLGPHQQSRFVLDPTNLPFVLYLLPNSRAPLLKVSRRNPIPEHDAYVAGRLHHLLRLIDNDQDADAAFFSRAITVTGDTEAVVTLRNAIDDIDRPLAAAAADAFGPPGRAALSFMRFSLGRSLP